MKKQAQKWILLLTGLIIAATAYAFAADPGSTDDPLVTKSYVDQKIAALQGGAVVESPAAAVFTPVAVTAGKKLLAGEGTELILRSGKATALDNGKDGVADLTAGADLKAGAAVGLNHHLLAPRGDGRGLKATTNIWVMVKGSYTIQ